MLKILLIFSLLIVTSLSTYSVMAESMSPRAQIESGIALHKIQCKDGFELILKATNLTPACVKPATATKLQTIGWAASSEIKMSKLSESQSMASSQQIEVEEKMKTDSVTEMGNDDKIFVGQIDVTHAAPLDGAMDAQISIVEFGDFQCPKCNQWFLNEKPTIQSEYIDTGKANLYFLDFTFLGENSDDAANASYCADDQSAYWDYHSHLYTNQKGINDGWASIPSLKAYAISVGLNSNEFSDCIDNKKHTDRVSYNEKVGTANGVAGTPTFYLMGPNGQTERIDGPQPASVFVTIIESMLSDEPKGKSYTVELEESVSGTSP